MLATLVLCLSLALAPEADARAEAQGLFDSGQAKYETHDYAGAIVDFTAAYNLALEFDDEAIRDEALARLAFNLARAHVFAHDLDGDASHLERARRLLADYRGHERQMGRDPDGDTDLERLEADLLARERKLASVRGGDEAAEPDPEPVGESRPRARAQRRAGISLLAITPAFAGLAIAGGVMASQASGDFTTVTTGDARLDARRRGRTGDVLLGVGVGLAAASAITGVTLFVVGGRARSRRSRFRSDPTASRWRDGSDDARASLGNRRESDDRRLLRGLLREPRHARAALHRGRSLLRWSGLRRRGCLRRARERGVEQRRDRRARR